MTPMAPPRPTSPPNDQLTATLAPAAGPPSPAACPQCRVPLLADPVAPTAARSVVQEAIRAWHVPVDAEAAVLLTSELVTNAVTHAAPAPGSFLVLTVACGPRELRVDVYDGSADLPVPGEATADAEAGRGLLLVTSLSAEWGFYRTPAGKAVYFTLALAGEAPGAADTDGTRATAENGPRAAGTGEQG